jgi:hypothetical protein
VRESLGDSERSETQSARKLKALGNPNGISSPTSSITGSNQ